MPEVHKIDDPSFWSIGPPSLDWMRVIAEAIDVQFARFPMGDPDDPATPFASVLRMPPNYELWRHKHDCHRVEVIVSGTLQIGDELLGPGDVMTSGPGEYYGPHVAGPEGTVTVEIFSSRTGVEFMLEPDPRPEVLEFFEGLLHDEDPERRAAAQRVVNMNDLSGQSGSSTT